MSHLPIIYYGEHDLQAQVLDSYCRKLGFCFSTVNDLPTLMGEVRSDPESLVIVAVNASPDGLIGLARLVIDDPSNAFPHVFLLYPGKPFDAQMESVTVLSGKHRLSDLKKHLYALLRH